MNVFATLAILAALAFIGFAAYVRLAPSDPARWHVDPRNTEDPKTPNFARVDRHSPLPPDRLHAQIAARAAAEGAEQLAGDDRHITYVARTRIMRYPDYVSIRLEPTEDGGTRITALSRARFGHADMGVNRARLARWLDGS